MKFSLRNVVCRRSWRPQRPTPRPSNWGPRTTSGSAHVKHSYWSYTLVVVYFGHYRRRRGVYYFNLSPEPRGKLRMGYLAIVNFYAYWCRQDSQCSGKRGVWLNNECVFRKLLIHIMLNVGTESCCFYDSNFNQCCFLILSWEVNPYRKSCYFYKLFLGKLVDQGVHPFFSCLTNILSNKVKQVCYKIIFINSLIYYILWIFKDIQYCRK